jgi:hypothetical protein
MPYRYHRSTIYALIVILVLFALLFFLALLNMRRGRAVFGITIPYEIEDTLIMVLSAAAMLRVVLSLVRIEHRRELMQRV